MTPPKITPRQLAEEHWLWIEAILNKRQEETRLLFLDAFIHGYKHGRESKK